jgi:hypothetical protein
VPSETDRFSYSSRLSSDLIKPAAPEACVRDWGDKHLVRLRRNGVCRADPYLIELVNPRSVLTGTMMVQWQRGERHTSDLYVAMMPHLGNKKISDRMSP